MGSEGNRHFFPLTSLQIGDLQSYLSRLTLYLAPESKKLFILVDNRPWLIDRNTRPAHLWQLMVTKSRMSPFANRRAERVKKDIGKQMDSTIKSRSIPIKLKNWFSLIDAASCQKKALLPVKKLDSFLLNKELHHTLYGFIVFEVAWNHVRGINYLNQLQTDTSMALEAKLMKRWEFDSIEQASSFVSSWYSGTYYECFLLEGYLDTLSGKEDVFYDAEEDISVTDGDREHVNDDDEYEEDEVHSDDSSSIYHCPGVEYLPYTPPPPCGSYKRRKIMRYSSGSETDEIPEAYSEALSSLSVSSSSSHSVDSEKERLISEAAIYKDVLILFRFNDHGLPFKLKEIIMSDLRLLTLLEYGLPSWVIFLQSYPLFCKIYRPWMCPLARALYVLISVATVLIGFYDLYKNVPLLKATMSRLFGPFFDWIETWEMISRIKCLGTMLFLHNFEKAVNWLLMITRATRSLLSVLTKPIAGPILELMEFIFPVWCICLETVEMLCSAVWIVLGSSCSIVMDILEIILSPFWLIMKTIWNIATLFIYPIIWVFWEIFIAPARLVAGTASFIAMLFSRTYYFLNESWSSLSSVFQLASASEARNASYEVSMWRSLWNDLFSQVFRALRSILYGFVAFFATCNRHRLSIYNHFQEFLLQLSYVTHRSNYSDSSSLRKFKGQNPLEDCGSRKVNYYASPSDENLHARKNRRSKQSEKRRQSTFT